MRFASLGSGSRGNGTLVAHDGACLLVDCGFSLRETHRRLARLGLVLEDLDALVITHGHRDHVAGLGPVARALGRPVWMTHGTWEECRQAGVGPLPEVRLFDGRDGFSVGPIGLHPFPVPHDAREPCQFVFEGGGRRLGLLTDTGASTAHIEACLAGVDALLVECNHDSGMLASGPYPPALKQRVGGDYGHLANHQAAALVARLDSGRLQHLVAMHLSAENNRPDLARNTLAAAAGWPEAAVAVAGQEGGLDWRELD